MNDINIVERIWQQYDIARENNDIKRFEVLTVLLIMYNSILNQLKTMEINAEKSEGKSVPQKPTPINNRCCTFEVTRGAIEQNYLSISELKKCRLIPGDRQEIRVRTSTGDIFPTIVLSKEGRLRDRKHIRAFYEDTKISPGDRVLWKEEIPGKQYYIEKV